MAFQYLYLHVISRSSDITSITDLALLVCSSAYFQNDMSSNAQSADIASLLSTMCEVATERVNQARTPPQTRTTESHTSGELGHDSGTGDFDSLQFPNATMSLINYMPTYSAPGTGSDSGWLALGSGLNFYSEPWVDVANT